MAQPTQDGIKEKVLAVREVVRGRRSNNEIVLVLQYYDYSIEAAIQAFVEDGAKEALEEWHYRGTKPSSKKKKKKKQTKAPEPASTDSPQAATASPATATTAPSTEENRQPTPSDTSQTSPAAVGAAAKEESVTENGPLKVEGSQRLADVVEDASSTAAAEVGTGSSRTSRKAAGATTFEDKMAAPAPVSSASTNRHPTQHKRPHNLENRSKKGGRAARERTSSEMSTSSIGSSTYGEGRAKNKPHAGLEKSMKDLQRQITALQRLPLVLNEEVEKSYKAMAEIFESLRLALNEREAELMFDMDKAKQQAIDTLGKRQNKAKELRVRADRSQGMTEAELSGLRADIKHFVSDHKIDEDSTKSAHFHGDGEGLLNSIRSFGEISRVKHTHTMARHASVSSVSSSIVSHEEPVTPVTPSTPVLAAHSPTPGDSASSGNHSNAPSSVQSSVTKPREVNSSKGTPHEDASSLSPTHKSASTSPVRVGKPPTTKTAVLSQPDLDFTGDVRKSRNARRRQKQRDREREVLAISMQSDSLPTPNASTPTPPPSSSLEKKTRTQVHGPRNVADRGTSPMKQTPRLEQPGGPASSGGQLGSQPEGQGQREPRGPGPFQGAHVKSQDPRQSNTSHHQPKEPQDHRSRGPRAPQENRPVHNGSVNGIGMNGTAQDHSQVDKTGSQHRSGAAANSVGKVGGPKVKEPLKQNDLKLNKPEERQHSAPDGGKKEVTADNSKLIENGAAENTVPKALPQRRPRNRGSKHAQENQRSQVMVNGSEEPPSNGHS